MIDLLRLDVGGVPIRVQADRSSIRLPFLCARGSRGVAPPPAHAREVRFQLRVRSPRKVLLRDGVPSYVSTSLADVLDALEGALYERILDGTPAAPLHAGSVLTPRGAIVIVGCSGAGKSSLTTELLARGAGRYMGDEHAFVWPRRLVSAIPRRMSGRRRPRRDDVALGPAPLALIVALRLPRTPEVVEQLEPARAAAVLLSSMLRLPRATDVATLSRVCATVPVFELAVEGVGRAAELIIELASVRLQRPRGSLAARREP